VAGRKPPAKNSCRPSLHEMVATGTGTTLRWFRSVFGDGLTYEQLIAEGARVAPGSEGLLCFPYVEGATVPIQDDTARAVYYGIGGHHRRAHFTRSTLEGIAYQYPALLDVVRTRGHQVGPMTISDGEARSHLWNQIKADVMGQTIMPSLRVEAPSIRAAILAGLGTDLFASVDDALAVVLELAPPVTPDPSTAAYATPPRLGVHPRNGVPRVHRITHTSTTPRGSFVTATLPDTIRTRAYIDGQFVDAADGTSFESFAPATGEVIAKITACGEEDVDRAVVAARAAFEKGTWSKISPAERKTIMYKFADLIEAHADELALIEAIDAGKPITDCRDFDIPDVLNTLRWYAEAADKVFGKTSPTGADHVGLIIREPVGVVGGVLPWNFPMAMLAWKIGPALATGNSVVIKPPELATLTSLRLAELASQAGIPNGVFNVIPGLGHIAGKALGLHPDVDMVTFTGSTEVGRAFLRYSADSNLKGIVLECGGKSPQIVMADCRDQLDAVAADLADAAFWNAGQNCSAGSRILVQSSIKEEFVSALAREANKRIVGDLNETS